MAWTGAAGPRRMRHRGRRQPLILTPPRAPSALVVGVLGPAHNRACRRARTNQSWRVQDEFVEMLDPVMGAKSNSNPCPTRPPILCLGERNKKSRSNPPLIRFLRIGELSSSTSRLLHLGAPAPGSHPSGGATAAPSRARTDSIAARYASSPSSPSIFFCICELDLE